MSVFKLTRHFLNASVRKKKVIHQGRGLFKGVFYCAAFELLVINLYLSLIDIFINVYSGVKFKAEGFFFASLTGFKCGAFRSVFYSIS